MKKEEFQVWIKGKVVLLDGATGSNLQKRGMPLGVCPEKWIVDHPQVLIQLQKEYVEAGSNIVYAPTFSANRIKLKEYKLEDQVDMLNKRLVAISKEAVGNKALVAGDMTMTGEQLAPLGTLTFEELVSVYKEQVTSLQEAGVDLIIIETMLSLQETRAALLAVKEASDLPVLVTMSFEENGTTLYGTTAETAVLVLQSLGADGVGVNCSTGPDKMLQVIKRMQVYATIPLIAKPNAGLPQLNPLGETVYDMPAHVFKEHMKNLVEQGAQIVGGCCGTNPDYIKAVKESMREIQGNSKLEVGVCPKAISTNERVILPYHAEKDLKVGEKICYQTDVALREDLEDLLFDTVFDYIDDQQEAGVDLIQIDVDSGNEEEDMNTIQLLLREVANNTKVPLVLTTDNVAVAETGIRHYPGICMFKGKKIGERAEFVKLANHYGAILLS